MISAKIYGVFSTVISAATVSASVVRAPETPVSIVAPLTEVPFVGAVPIFAVGVGVLTALLVRVIVMTSSPHKLVSYNVAVTGLAMLGTATFIIDHQTGPGIAFWVGAAFGAVGVGIIQIAQSKIFGSIVDGLKTGLRKGVDDHPDTP